MQDEHFGINVVEFMVCCLRVPADHRLPVSFLSFMPRPAPNSILSCNTMAAIPDTMALMLHPLPMLSTLLANCQPMRLFPCDRMRVSGQRMSFR